MSRQIDRIDVHHHIMPTWYVEEAKSMGAKDGGGVEFPAWSVETALALVDRKGIKTAMTSIAAPGVHGSDHPFAPEPLIEAEIQGLERYKGFDDAALKTIEQDNALALFPRLNATAGVR